MNLKGIELEEVSNDIWRIEPFGKMRVGVHLVGSEKLLKRIENDRSLDQAINVAALPGLFDPVLAMPDIHQGYGFPIGGVAAFHLKTGVVSPGGVGYDINCGVRLLTSNLDKEEIEHRDTMRSLIASLFDAIPCGVGGRRKDLSLSDGELNEVLETGAKWAVKKGFGSNSDLDHIEERGRMPSSNPEFVSSRAKERGLGQIGTLGSGNHFVEIQFVAEIFDSKTAERFGVYPGQVVVSIHTGSRGLGYQVCEDFLDLSLEKAKGYGIELPDRELAAVPIASKEGQEYLGAMAAAANFAFANRTVISHWVKEVFMNHFPQSRWSLLCDVCHNIAKIESFQRKGRPIEACIHRKGATRAWFDQPILIPGDMGRCSYLLVGTKEALELSFGSACHGAGRELSRAQAKKRGKGRAISRELEDRGIYSRSAGRATMIEEMSEAYKDVSEVVGSVEKANLAIRVAKLIPMGVIKG